MNSQTWALSDDLPLAWVVVVLAVVASSLVFLLLELRNRERGGPLIAATGVLAMLLLLAAVLRPVSVRTRGSLVGPRVVVLVDQSRRLALPAGDGTRFERATGAARQLGKHFSDARLEVFGFGEGDPQPMDLDESGARTTQSDLVGALSWLADSPGERPSAVVVISDGRLTRPVAGLDDEALRRALGDPEIPVHTVKLLDNAPPDASVVAVLAAGAAVAHQPLALTIKIGCFGGLQCGEIPVHVRELRHDVEPAVLASGVAQVEEGVAQVELSITLERAGARVVEVGIDTPDGDTIPENDSRVLTFDVTRERVRLLHVAGRPTYDVRALRRWLKGDEGVDLVAFFILRGDHDDPGTDRESELALIPFPVDELFTEHLPSFDAVLLQDIDAIRYQLARHLPALARYVESGGGLIMVGGPSSFVGGNYGGTALDRVMPVEMPENAKPFDTVGFEPAYTEPGRAAPVLHGVRELLGEKLPEMPGSNTLGPARKGAIVLWEHSRRSANDAENAPPMPVLALGESGDGRAIALGIDGTHLLAFSQLAATAGGRAYGALWDGLVGWLMRDPRYEAARVTLLQECIAGEPTTLRVTPLPGSEGDVSLELERLGAQSDKSIDEVVKNPPPGPVDVSVGKLEVGGYTARIRIGQAPPTRFDFACERGGAAWADSRPDPERLARIAEVTGGVHVDYGSVDELSLPESTEVAAERHVSPLLPPWVWTLAAALALGGHWIARRRGGLS